MPTRTAHAEDTDFLIVAELTEEKKYIIIGIVSVVCDSFDSIDPSPCMIQKIVTDVPSITKVISWIKGESCDYEKVKAIKKEKAKRKRIKKRAASSDTDLFDFEEEKNDDISALAQAVSAGAGFGFEDEDSSSFDLCDSHSTEGLSSTLPPVKKFARTEVVRGSPVMFGTPLPHLSMSSPPFANRIEVYDIFRTVPPATASAPPPVSSPALSEAFNLGPPASPSAFLEDPFQDGTNTPMVLPLSSPSSEFRV